MPVVGKRFGTDLHERVLLALPAHDGMRLDAFLRLHLGSFSREALKERIRLGRASLPGRRAPVRPSTRVRGGDTVVLRFPRGDVEGAPRDARGAAGPAGGAERHRPPRVLFEDEGLLCVSKPPFMPVHPTGRHLFDCATVLLEGALGRPVHSVHRLDRETSGVLLLGKGPRPARELAREFEAGRVGKAYLLAGLKRPGWGGRRDFEVDARLGPGGGGPLRLPVRHHPAGSRLGKRARTVFRVVEELPSHVLALAFPETGRQHQIRVHAMLAGIPLVGDKLYLGGADVFGRFKDGTATEADRRALGLPRHALHALALSVRRGGRRRTFFDGLPPDLADWMGGELGVDVPALSGRLAEWAGGRWGGQGG